MTREATMREEYETQGIVSECFVLSDQSGLSTAAAEADHFESAARQYREHGLQRVPYFFTPTIERIARDESLVRTIEAVLGPGERWVCWGPNVRRSTPNAAQHWHVDLESFLWPGSITVAVGLAGCRPEATTRCIPGSQRLSKAPDCAGDDSNSDLVVRKAARLDDRCGQIQSFNGFGDGRFYLFDGRCWHQGSPKTPPGTTRLFLHYQRASAPRVPLMLDYGKRRWAPEPSPYIEGGPPGTASQRLYPLPWKERLHGLLRWRP